MPVLFRERDAALASRGGAQAGAVGAVAMWAWMILQHALHHQDLWTVFKGPSAAFLHDRAMAPGFDGVAVVVGILCHLAVSIGWGWLFGIVAYGLSRPLTVLTGFFWGFVVWVGMFYVVLPIAGLSQMARQVDPIAIIAQHLFFGFVVALAFLPYQRTLAAPLGGLRDPLNR